MIPIKMNGHGQWVSTKVNREQDSPEMIQALDDLNAAQARLDRAHQEVDEAQNDLSDATFAVLDAQTNQRTQT